MTARQPIDVHAICLTLGEAEFLEASLGSVYSSVSGITVVTTYDRDWRGRRREPDATVELILSRRLDPDHKIQLVVLNETSEPRSRNRAMDLVAGRRRSARTSPMTPVDLAPTPPDYFLFLDSDEVWEQAALDAAFAEAARSRRPVYEAAAVRYFKSWTVRIDGLEWLPVLYRADVRTNWLRHRRRSLMARLLSRMPGTPEPVAAWLRGIWRLPSGAVTFHHGSYVGGMERISAKLASFGHADEVHPDWLTGVWDAEPSTLRDFHPTHPRVFSRAMTIPIDELPEAVLRASWPEGYLE